MSSEPSLHRQLFSLWGSRDLGRASEHGSWHVTAACRRTTDNTASAWQVCSVTAESLLSAPESTCLGPLCPLSSVGAQRRLHFNSPHGSASLPLQSILLAGTSSHVSNLIKTTTSLCFYVSLLRTHYDLRSLLYGPQFPHL